MNSLEVLGAAVIWLSVGFLLLIISAIILELAIGWIRRRAVQRAVWVYREEFVDQEMLDNLISYESSKWWKAHERERMWCRASDYQEGMRAAARHLVRMHGKLTSRNRPNRAQVKCWNRIGDDWVPTPEELVRLRDILREHRVEV